MPLARLPARGIFPAQFCIHIDLVCYERPVSSSVLKMVTAHEAICARVTDHSLLPDGGPSEQWRSTVGAGGPASERGLGVARHALRRRSLPVHPTPPTARRRTEC